MLKRYGANPAGLEIIQSNGEDRYEYNSGRREGSPALHSGPMKVDAVWYFGGSTTIQSTIVVRPKIQPRHWKRQPLPLTEPPAPFTRLLLLSCCLLQVSSTSVQGRVNACTPRGTTVIFMHANKPWFEV